MTEEYAKCWAQNSRPYDGIPELLVRLDDLNLVMAVLSNKPDDFTKLMVHSLLPACPFRIVQGHKPPVPIKPDPTAALDIADKLRIPPYNFLYLGDTKTDMLTATAAGMFPVGVLWGFRTADELIASGAKALVEKPLDVLSLFDPNP